MAEEIVGKKMSEYASVDTLTGEEKATYLGNALVTSIGSKTVGGSLENYNVPLSEIGGSGLPDASSASVGDVLTLNNSKEPIWQAPQGGGGWTYTKATGTFGEKTESPFPGEYFNQTTRELPVSNHTYTVVPNNVDTGGGNDTQAVIIKLEQSEFPDAYVQFKTSDSNITSLHHIVVDNGSTRLIRLYNAGAISDGAVYEVQAYLEDNQEIEVHAPTTWDERFPGNESTVLVHIFGDTYTIYCSGKTMYDGNAE